MRGPPSLARGQHHPSPGSVGGGAHARACKGNVRHFERVPPLRGNFIDFSHPCSACWRATLLTSFQGLALRWPLNSHQHRLPGYRSTHLYGFGFFWVFAAGVILNRAHSRNGVRTLVDANSAGCPLAGGGDRHGTFSRRRRTRIDAASEISNHQGNAFGFQVAALRRGCCARSFARHITQARYRAARSGGSRGTFFEEEGPESAQQANA